MKLPPHKPGDLLFVLLLAVFAVFPHYFYIYSNNNHIIKELAMLSGAMIFTAAAVFRSSAFTFKASYLPALFLVASAVLSGINAVSRADYLAELAKYPVYMLIIFIPRLLNGKRELDKLLFFAAVSGTVSSIYGLIQYAGFDFVPWTQHKLQSTMGNPNNLAHYLILVTPLTVYFALSPGSMIKKTVFWLFTSINALCLYLTYSRGGWLGFTAGAVFLIIYFLRKKLTKKNIAAGALTVILLVALLPVLSGTVRSIFNIREPSNYIRLLMWKGSADMLRDNPFLGAGFGNFRLNYFKYKTSAEELVAGRHQVAEKAHNDYMQFAAEGGLPALSSFLLLGVFCLKRAFGLLRRCRSDYLTAAVLAGLLSTFVHVLFDYNLRMTVPASVFWLFAGIVMLGPEEKKNDRRRSSFLLTVPALLMAAFFVLSRSSAFVDEINLRSGLITTDDSRAVYFLDRALGSGRYYADACITLTNIYRKTADWEKSSAYCWRILRREPYNFLIMATLGNNSAQLNRYGDALYYLKRSISIYNSNDSVYNDIGSIYAMAGDYAGAAAAFRRSVAIAPGKAIGYRNLAGVYINSGDAAGGARVLLAGVKRASDGESLRELLVRVSAAGQGGG